MTAANIIDKLLILLERRPRPTGGVAAAIEGQRLVARRICRIFIVARSMTKLIVRA